MTREEARGTCNFFFQEVIRFAYHDKNLGPSKEEEERFLCPDPAALYLWQRHSGTV